MEHPSVNADLRRLEADERALSNLRGILHRRIEFVAGGGASDPDQLDALRTQERDISWRRMELHRIIDEVRDVLGLPPWRPDPKPERENWR